MHATSPRARRCILDTKCIRRWAVFSARRRNRGSCRVHRCRVHRCRPFTGGANHPPFVVVTTRFAGDEDGAAAHVRQAMRAASLLPSDADVVFIAPSWVHTEQQPDHEPGTQPITHTQPPPTGQPPRGCSPALNAVANDTNLFPAAAGSGVKSPNGIDRVANQGAAGVDATTAGGRALVRVLPEDSCCFQTHSGVESGEMAKAAFAATTCAGSCIRSASTILIRSSR